MICSPRCVNTQPRSSPAGTDSGPSLSKLEEIARKLGVAPSTVSRALSGKPGVSQAKRQRIIEHARSIGYEPDAFAQSLRTGETHRGATVVKPLRATDIAQISIDHVFVLARAQFGSLNVISVSDYSQLDEILSRAIAERPKAIVLAYAARPPGADIVARIRKRKIPTVVIDSGGSDELDFVGLDRSAGTFMAARLLLLSGCRHPLFFTCAAVGQPDARETGILRAFNEMGRGEPTFVRTTNIDNFFAEGERLMDEILRTRAVDGIFTYSDEMAIGALRSLHRAGVTVPDQVRVVGFDNIPVTAHLTQSLSTVAQPVHDLAEIAIDMLKKRSADPSIATQKKILAPRLIVRETAPVTDHTMRNELFGNSLPLQCV